MDEAADERRLAVIDMPDDDDAQLVTQAGSGKPGKRYRSLGDEDITSPVDSNAATLDEVIAELETTKTSERAGRAMDRETEDAFERLRAEGYM